MTRRVFLLVRDTDRDAPRTGAEVEDCRRIERLEIAERFEDERLGLRPRHEHRGRDLERQQVEVARADEVRHRPARDPPLDQFAKARSLGLGRLLIVADEKIDLAALEDVGEQDLRLGPRALDPLGREESVVQASSALIVQTVGVAASAMSPSYELP